MLESLEIAILAALQTIYDQFGWLGVFTMLVFENATGITPSEIILGLAGWMLLAAHQAPASAIFGAGLIAAAGSTFGASLAYWAARLGGRPLIDRIARRLRINLEQIDRSEQLFNRYGAALVLGGRVIPAVRTFISIPAGLARMPFHRFLGATILGSYVWCTLLIGAGYWLGEEWSRIGGMLRQFYPHIFSAAALIVLGYAAWFYLRPRPATQPARIRSDE